MPIMDQMRRYKFRNQDNTKRAVGVAAVNTRLYGLRIENDSTSADVFLQAFDAAATTDVTLGTTVPNFSLKIPAGGAVILDPNVRGPLEVFGKGLVFAITSTREGANAPATNAYCEFIVGQN